MAHPFVPIEDTQVDLLGDIKVVLAQVSNLVDISCLVIVEEDILPFAAVGIGLKEASCQADLVVDIPSIAREDSP